MTKKRTIEMYETLIDVQQHKIKKYEKGIAYASEQIKQHGSDLKRYEESIECSSNIIETLKEGINKHEESKND